MLRTRGIEFDTIDIAAPGMETQRSFMRTSGRRRDGQRNVLPPQIFNGEHFRNVVMKSIQKVDPIMFDLWVSTVITVMISCIIAAQLSGETLLTSTLLMKMTSWRSSWGCPATTARPSLCTRAPWPGRWGGCSQARSTGGTRR